IAPRTSSSRTPRAAISRSTISLRSEANKLTSPEWPSLDTKAMTQAPRLQRSAPCQKLTFKGQRGSVDLIIPHREIDFSFRMASARLTTSPVRKRAQKQKRGHKQSAISSLSDLIVV